MKNKDVRERRNTSFKGGCTPRKSYKVGTLSTNVGETDARKKSTNQPRAWCKKQHDLDSCQEFLKKPLKDRVLFLIRSGLCLRCLEHGHMAKENKFTTRRRCTSCKNLHPTCLHKEPKKRSLVRQKKHLNQHLNQHLPSAQEFVEPKARKLDRTKA